jgi:general L-amino acid transport system substrate-binding protein
MTRKGINVLLLRFRLPTPVHPISRRRCAPSPDGLRDPNPVVRLGALQSLANAPANARLSLAAPLLSDPVRAVRIEAASILAPVPLEQLSAEQRAAFERASVEYIATQCYNAHRAEARTNSWDFLWQSRGCGESQEELKAALRLEPLFIPAYVNLSDLYRAVGRDPDGEHILREGLKISPKTTLKRRSLYEGYLFWRWRRQLVFFPARKNNDDAVHGQVIEQLMDKPIHASMWRSIWALTIVALAIGGTAPGSQAGEIFTRVRSKGMIHCGVGEGSLGFSLKESNGRWTGLDVDFCRATAAAALGDSQKVVFVPLLASARFLALRSGQIDLLSRNTTWTLGRDVGLGVQFAGILYYDGQGFMVARKSRIAKIDQLKGAAICVEAETTSEENLKEHFRARSWPYQPVRVQSVAEAMQAFSAERCRAYTSDRGQLAALRVTAPGGPGAYLILPGEISKEPLGPAVLRGDEAWFTLVRWVFFALIAAEEHGITRDNVQEKRQQKADPVLEAFFAASSRYSKALGVEPDWVVKTIGSVGNYGEMFERNLGGQSALKLERGLNRLWKDGGLMYAPPFR